MCSIPVPFSWMVDKKGKCEVGVGFWGTFLKIPFK